MTPDQEAGGHPGGALFPNTRWTLIEDVRAGGERGERALGELCRIYWYPVYAFVRRSGAAPADAEDLAQGFFARLLERGDLATADSEKGRLRTFLSKSLKNFTYTEHRRSVAQKRGGGAQVVSIDAAKAESRFSDEPAEIDDPESLFERRWALALLDEALRRVKAEYVRTGRAEVFEAISPFLSGRDKSDDRYDAVAERIELSRGAVQVAVHRLRKRYRRELEAAVAETLEDTDDTEEELRHVLRVLSRD